MRRSRVGKSGIYRRDNGVFYFRGTLEIAGEKKQIEASLKTKVEEETAFMLAQLTKRLEKEAREFKAKIAGPLMREYLAVREKSNKRESTKRESRDMINNYLEPFFGRMNVGDINFEKWEAYCRKNGSRDYTNHRKVLIHFLKWCFSRDLLFRVPSLEVPEWETRERLVLTQEEIVKLLVAAKGDMLLYVSMYLFMGMRNSEIIKLTWSRVDLDHRSVFLRKEDTKTKRPRSVPINEFVLELLRSRKSLSTGPYVFPGRNTARTHRGVSSFVKSWHRLLKRAEIDRVITPHDLRATCETYAAKRVDFTDAQREKFAGANIDLQKSIYIQMGADDVRGLEASVSFPELDGVLKNKCAESAGNGLGKELGDEEDHE